MPDEPERNHLAHGAKYRAAKLPLRAFIDAPTSGGAWPKDVKMPRAVSNAWYERMCPPERRYLVNTKEVNNKMGLNLGNAEGLDIVTKWGKYLKTLSDKPCVELIHGSDRLIDWEYVEIVLNLLSWRFMHWVADIVFSPSNLPVSYQTLEYSPSGPHSRNHPSSQASIGPQSFSVQ